MSCRRPSNRSSRLALPLGPSNSYSFSTASHGIRRRSAASASRARVNSFSFTSSCWRAASHSCGDTILERFISLASVSRSISFSFILFSSGLVCFFFLQNLLIIKAVSPPLDVAPAAVKAAFVRQTGHIALVLSFLAGSLMRLFQILGQAIERSFPKLAIFFHPLRGFLQRLRFQLHLVHAPIAATPEQPCFFQHAQMF